MLDAPSDPGCPLPPAAFVPLPSDLLSSVPQSRPSTQKSCSAPPRSPRRRWPLPRTCYTPNIVSRQITSLEMLLFLSRFLTRLFSCPLPLQLLTVPALLALSSFVKVFGIIDFVVLWLRIIRDSFGVPWCRSIMAFG